MNALTLQSASLAPGVQKQQQATCGRSLTSNYSPPSLENKFLAQTSTVMPQLSSPLIDFAGQPSSCSSLQPSKLSSTSSSLLSTSSFAASFTSPLLSTQNKLLDSNLSHHSFSLTSSVPNDSLLPTSLASGALLTNFAQTPSFFHHDLMSKDEKRDDGWDPDDRYEISEVMPFSFEETSVISEDEDNEAEEIDAEKTMDLPVLETELMEQELEQTEVVRQEEFGEVERGNEKAEEELKDKKYFLLNIVCCSLVNESTAPGQKDWDSEDSVWTRITNLAKDISAYDPQFLLKVALYTRQKLNIRITANFLLALAANLPPTKPHVRRYFCAAVQLPSDWLEIVRIYSTCFSRSLPMCLKKAMADKFKQFSEYQLAKYNTRKHRCKHNRNKRKAKKPTDTQMKEWADLIRSNTSILKNFLRLKVVDKKQSEFSIKKMIKRLHIKEPAEHVMAILGKKYPADVKAFTHSGMKGVWDRERAGQRMKLKEPQTWERLLSMEGNKAATWEKLIDTKSLPFMAMLRNLRNMITKGISEAHHNKILSRLTNEKAVVQSRQFPFRFLAAYKVIMELYAIASAAQQQLPSANKILMDILKKIPKSQRLQRLTWETTKKSRIRLTLRVPFISRMYRMKKAQLIKANQRNYTVALLDRYRKALETAVQISCRQNVPPLPGRTLILLSPGIYYDQSAIQKLDFCLPPDPEEQENEEKEAENPKPKRRKTNIEDPDKLTPSKMEVAVLLALMISSSTEDCELCITYSNQWKEAKLKSDVLLENVRSVLKQIKNIYEDNSEEGDSAYFNRILKSKKVSNIIVLSESWLSTEVSFAIRNYRTEINSSSLVVHICSDSHGNSETLDRNHVVLTGFSEQVLRFVAERGSSRLLDHVEHLDKLYNIPPPEGGQHSQTTSNVVSIPTSPKLRWQGVRVFISSTFRDMHSERDILVRSVFPELRRRAAPHCLYLQEVELRWGVTEEESERASELCLSEVCRSQMLVGILGERYGQVPPKPDLPDLPQYSWLASAPAGLSITEMEIRQFQALYPDVAHQRMLCYFRDPNIINSVPVAWRSHFAPESTDAAHKMASLKGRLLSSDVKVTENYSCEWGGVVDGKPYLKNLEDFGNAVLEDLWMAVKKLFVDEAEEAEAASEVLEQEVHQEAMQRQFFGRSKLLSNAVDLVEQAQTKGGMIVVEAGPGEGKTVFMAALAEALRTGVKSKKNLVCDVISYSTAASQSAHSVEKLLRCLVKWLRKIKGTEEESPFPHSYKDLLSEFHSTLSNIKRNKPLVLLVDGADLVQDGRGQVSSDWIPQQLPRVTWGEKGVCLVVSITSKAALLQTLTKKKGTLLFTLGQLTLPDRKEIVQKELDAFGKKLSDSAFNNQLQTLISKKGAVSPLYLHLACEDLRNFASFDKLKESLQDLPQSLRQLVQYSLQRLCSQYRGMLGLRWALATLTVSTTGLKERDLYSVLNTCNDLSLRDGRVTWQEVLQLSREPKGRIPMATFTRIVQSLQSLIGPSHCHNTDDLLALTNPEVKRAFEDFFLPTESDKTRAHLTLAAHLWTQADPRGQNTFLHCEANSITHLPSSLIQSGQLGELSFLLSSYYFLYANVRHGFLHHLLETYSWYGTPELSELLSTFPSEPTSLVVSQDDQMMVVGTGEGTLHFIHTQTGQEVKSLISSCDGISSCVFLKDLRLATTSFDGRIEVWDIENGCRTDVIDGHTNMITGSDVTADKKHLATVSLDCMIKVWSSDKGTEVSSVLSRSPMNCVTFEPKGHLLAAGCWNGNVIMWNWLKNKKLTSLCGHTRSVRSLSFSPYSSMLCSGSVSGEVRVWSVPTSTCVGCFQAHCEATESLTFLAEGSMLLSAGSDHMLNLWSGGLGRSVTALKCDDWMQEPPLKKLKAVTSQPAALCVAVNGDYVAVGYHADGIKLFSLRSGEKIWASVDLDVSVPCMLWVILEAEQTDTDLLVSGGSDKFLRVWKRKQEEEGMTEVLEMVGVFGVQSGTIQALAQNSTYLATASDDFTIGLWLLSDLTCDPPIQPNSILRGHSGGVTCLAFSPDGAQLLSGGKDQALMVWDVTAPAVRSKTLPHAHRDWVTGCVWTPDCVLSSSNDGRLCLWDLQAGQCLREISWTSPLTSVCCLGQYVIASCAEGALHVWKWETNTEICHISAHMRRIHHCSLLPNTDKGKEVKSEEMSVFTASDDGTVKFWKPLQVEHFSTFRGHSGAIHGVVCKERVPQFFTVSEDRSLRCWTWTTASPPNLKGSVTALCFCQNDDLLVAGYESGLLELWQNNSVVGHKQVFDDPITAVCFMPDSQIAVASVKLIGVWKLVWNKKHETASLVNVTIYKDSEPVVCLFYCTALFGVNKTGEVFDVAPKNNEGTWHNKVNNWLYEVEFHCVIHNDKKSVWLVGESKGEIYIGFLFPMSRETCLQTAFSTLNMKCDEEEEEGKKKRTLITAVIMDNDFVVCGDAEGNMWFNRPPELSSWSKRKPAHSDRISVLRLTDSTIISASYDRTVKLWDRDTKNQVGLFVCGGPVLILEVNPQRPTELVCSDGERKLYFLSREDPDLRSSLSENSRQYQQAEDTKSF
ncbi:telomerase protein component 1 [Neolamprologus brichardi]|uniref:telomerase protein component 1 n=1 Tax=Neolamprologus brichardi TaxID=32507 RepID=UPI001643D25C|nr:telomerase protein component 1 [Neolamprologus brichardi]